MAKYTYLPTEQCLVTAQETAEKAAEVALQYGAPQICPLIPGKSHLAENVAPNASGGKILKGDAQLQLNILRELSSAASEQIDVNTLFQMVIEGMHRGIGIERVAIAFISHYRVTAKYVLGEGTDVWRSKFDFDMGPYSDNIFVHALEEGGALWLDQNFITEHQHCYPTEIVKVLGDQPSFVCVLRVGERTPALFYADRADFGGKFTQDQFEGGIGL